MASGCERLIVILWRAGLRIGEALDLAETDLDAARGAVMVRRGKGGRRREVGMDRWAWSHLEPWIAVRRHLPVGALFCVIRGATVGRRWESSSARKQLARTAANAGVRRRLAPHQLRHAHAVEMHTRACRWSSSSASSGIMWVIPICQSNSTGSGSKITNIMLDPCG